MAEKRKILEVKHLKKYFPLKKGKWYPEVDLNTPAKHYKYIVHNYL